ncbi:hypothetical protein O181_029897 [Austropuccinia psidii MF-1]|uniref:Uncharacterized protein n=1 Tax=Austropuccinia psidii MF-1 TaxID=1389203 RepID=A0A9Q3H3X8_9BASI|nr:hypothetical protein [Austropuccinia psidii MF-1]
MHSFHISQVVVLLTLICLQAFDVTAFGCIQHVNAPFGTCIEGGENEAKTATAAGTRMDPTSEPFTCRKGKEMCCKFNFTTQRTVNERQISSSCVPKDQY